VRDSSNKDTFQHDESIRFAVGHSAGNWRMVG